MHREEAARLAATVGRPYKAHPLKIGSSLALFPHNLGGGREVSSAPWSLHLWTMITEKNDLTSYISNQSLSSAGEHPLQIPPSQEVTSIQCPLFTALGSFEKKGGIYW